MKKAFLLEFEVNSVIWAIITSDIEQQLNQHTMESIITNILVFMASMAILIAILPSARANRVMKFLYSMLKLWSLSAAIQALAERNKNNSRIEKR